MPRTFEVAQMRSQAFEAVRNSHASPTNHLFSGLMALSLVAISLGVGILIGFAGGYASAPRVTLPSAPVQEPVPASPAPLAVAPPVADAVQAAQPANPEVSSGSAIPSRAAIGSVSGVERGRSEGTARPLAVSARGTGPGSIEVVSRPAGAQVALDGRVVGITPLTIPDVATGTHVIGIELAGFSRWATSVHVDGGERARVGASLSR